MSYGPFAIEISCVFLLTLILFQRYSNIFRQHLTISIATICAWYASFIIISLLPLDISLTYHRQCLQDEDAARQHHLLVTSASPLPNVSATNLHNNNRIQKRDVDDLKLTTTAHLHVPNTSTTSASLILPSLTSTPTTRTTLSPASSGVVCEKPWDFLPPSALPTLWVVVYWTSQFLTWLFLPMLQSYSNAGNFTILGKIKTALVENAIWYGSYLLIFGLLLIYVAARPDLELDGGKLKVILITASNTWGLFLLVLLLGYGLVEVPRTVWASSKRGHTLSRVHFRVSKLSVERSDAQENLDDVIEDIKRINKQIKDSHPLRPNFETIVDKCPDNVQLSLRGGGGGRGERLGVGVGGDNVRGVVLEDDHRMETPTQKSLIHLHKRLISHSQRHNRVEVQWKMLVEKALRLDDISTNELSGDRRFKHTFIPQRPEWVRAIYTPAVEWYWQCVVRQYLLKAVSVILATISLMIIWSEVTFFNKSPVLSLFALALQLAKYGYHYTSIELISLFCITYLSVCAYYTIFHVKILNYYYLDSHQHTDSSSLLFSGMLLCRLTPALCLNFLGLIHLDSHITSDTGDEIQETAYTKIMGHMDVIGIVANGFNIYFPMSIILLCAATYFSLGARCLNMIGFEQFLADDDDLTDHMVSEGREIIRREKRSRQRVAETSVRRQEWAARFEESSRQRREAMEARDEDTFSPPAPTSTTHLRDPHRLEYNSSTNTDAYDTFKRGSVNRGRTSVPPRNIFDDV